MSSSVANQHGEAPRAIGEMKPAMVKASLRRLSPKVRSPHVGRKSEKPSFGAQIGACLDAARREVGWTVDQLAAELDRDSKQVGRWIRGEERTQVDVVFAVECLRGPFVIALARLADCCEIETVVRIKRTA